MSLQPGDRLGPYEIESLLGAGGMGEVYRARDTRLDRVVAIKVLPPGLAADPERRHRFEREAKTISALNHPHICTLHDVGEQDGTAFLVMEHLDGKTLTGHLEGGELPLQQALQLGTDIADALAYAHSHGVVHRDLKPGNVVLTSSGVKLLDFGLAKLKQESQDTRRPGVVTTEAVTASQVVLGTPAYMSPEQAEGKAADARSDVFSLGVMLYEMVTGRRPFQGESPLAVISSILKDTPIPLVQLKPDLPSDVECIVRRCLAKDPPRRYQVALDVRNELEDVRRQISIGAVDSAPVPVAARRPRSLRRAMGIVAGACVLAGVVSLLVWRSFDHGASPPPLRATFNQLTSQPGAELFAHLSPNGSWIVYTGEGAGNRDIFLQAVNGQRPINLTADSPADDEEPAFSPDGERIAFRSSRDGGGIFVMGLTGEAVRRVTREGFNPAWSPDGSEIAYTTVRTQLRPQNAEQRGRLMIVATAGGEPRQLYDSAQLPSWSPHGLRIAFSSNLHSPNLSTSNIATLPAAGGEPIPVTQDSFLNWDPVWTPDGRYLYFVSDRGGSTNIWRIAVDEASGRPHGEPEAITTPASFATHLSISADGRLLAYSSVLETQNIQRLQLDPVNGEVLGEPQPVTTGSRFWANPDPSPDGTRVVFYSQVGPEGDLFVARSDGSGAMRQLTEDAAIDRVPRWSPDGDRVAMFSDRSGQLQIWQIRVDGSDLRQLTHRPSSVAAWSPDGRRLAVTRQQNRPSEPSASIIDPDDPTGRSAVDLPPVPPPLSRFAPNSWSADGRRITGQNGFRTPGISVYSLDTRRFERLTDFGEWPVWLPDSQRILFVSRGREFHILDTRTGTTRLIFSVPRDTLGPPRLTRDGRWAYFSRRVTEADVWIATLH